LNFLKIFIKLIFKSFHSSPKGQGFHYVKLVTERILSLEIRKDLKNF